MLEEKKQPLDCVVEFKIDDAILFRRICGRWFHIPSGRSYHEEFYPPKIPGKDDVSFYHFCRCHSRTMNAVEKSTWCCTNFVSLFASIFLMKLNVSIYFRRPVKILSGVPMIIRKPCELVWSPTTSRPCPSWPTTKAKDWWDTSMHLWYES